MEYKNNESYLALIELIYNLNFKDFINISIKQNINIIE